MSTAICLLMADTRIDELRKKASLTVDELALSAGISRGYLNELKSGKKRLNMDIMKRLAKALGCRPQDLIADDTQALVPIVGHVGAGGHIFPIDDLPLIADTSVGLAGFVGKRALVDCIEYADAPPEAGHRNVVAVRVKGDSMVPAMQDGDLIYYKYRQEGNFDDLLNKRCIVKLIEGPTMVKVLKRFGDYPGRYNLFSYNADLMEDVQIEWAARIIFIKPS